MYELLKTDTVACECMCSCTVKCRACCRRTQTWSVSFQLFFCRDKQLIATAWWTICCTRKPINASQHCRFMFVLSKLKPRSSCFAPLLWWVATRLVFRFWHEPLECVAPDVDNNLQSGRFWAISIASFRDRLLDFTSCWIVFNHVIWGRASGLLHLSSC